LDQLHHLDANYRIMRAVEKRELCARDTAQEGAKKQQLTGSSPRTDLIAFAVK